VKRYYVLIFPLNVSKNVFFEMLCEGALNFLNILLLKFISNLNLKKKLVLSFLEFLKKIGNSHERNNKEFVI
jgi:hypothetical protein